MIRRMVRRPWVVVAAVAALVGVVAVAQAAIPDGNGVIHACYSSNGVLRVVDTGAGDACKSNEAGLDWNQQGVQGPAGPQGEQGPAGPAGPQGPAGASGVSGWELVRIDFFVPPGAGDLPGTAQDVTVSCPSGKKVLGGGVTTDAWVDSTVRQSGPNGAGTAWHVIIQRTNGGDSPFSGVTPGHAYAICANGS
jgi:hypothetical protein